MLQLGPVWLQERWACKVEGAGVLALRVKSLHRSTLLTFAFQGVRSPRICGAGALNPGVAEWCPSCAGASCARIARLREAGVVLVGRTSYWGTWGS